MNKLIIQRIETKVWRTKIVLYKVTVKNMYKDNVQRYTEEELKEIHDYYKELKKV